MTPSFYPLLWHNGRIKPSEGFSFPINTFLSTSEIELIEEYHAFSTNIIEIHEVYQRIKSHLNVYNINSPLFTKENEESFKEEIKRLHIRNSCYKWSCCYIWCRGNTETHENNTYILLKRVNSIFEVKQQPKLACIVQSIRIPSGVAIQLPSILHAYRKLILAEVESQECQVGILCNELGDIVDSSHGNLFAVHGNKIETTSIEQTSNPSIYRSRSIQMLTTLGYEVEESNHWKTEKLFQAQELFVVGNWGILAIKGIENKRFYDIVRIELTKEYIKQISQTD